MTTRLALLAVLAQASSPGPIGSVTIGQTSTYRLLLQAGEPSYRIGPLLKPGSYVFELVSDHPPLLARIEPTAPLRPGAYAIKIDSRVEDANRTFVFSLPVQPGRFFFTVTASGKARYEFILSGPGGPPQPAAFTAPQQRKAFRAVFRQPRSPSRRQH
jgi:hypothetical protein